MNRFLDKLSLHVKATLVMLSIIAAILIMIASVIIVQVRRHIALGEQRAATSMARSLAGAAELAMAVRDTHELQRLMDGFLRDQHVSFIAIYDDKDKLFAHTSRHPQAFHHYTLMPNDPDGPLIGIHKIHLTSVPDEFSVFDGVDSDAEDEPLTDGNGAILGQVVVGISSRPMREAQNTNTIIVVVITLLAGSVATLIISLAVRRWTRRLDTMVDASERISRGDFTCAVDEEGSDEIARLARAYNKMRDAVQARDRELRRFNDRLQHRVEQRTRALAAAKAEAEAAAESLQSSEARTRAIVESAVDGIITADQRGVIDSVNRAARDIFGYTEAELLGRPLEQLLNPDTVERLPLSDKTVAAVQLHESAGIRKDGSSIPIYLAVNRIHVADRYMITAVVHDLTEQKRLQRQLTQAQKLEAIGQLAAGVAHEINTPIQFVGDNARFLQEAFDEVNQVHQAYNALLDDAQHHEPLREAVERVRKQIEEVDMAFLNEEIPAALQQAADGVDRVAKIVRSMKEFAHPGSEGMAAIDLNHSIENTITVARNEWKYVAEIKTNFADNLPAIPCLPGELNQVMLNLIVNAAHAIEESDTHVGQKGVIEIATQLEDNHVLISVRDSGCGMPVHVRDRIFDPFFTTKAVGKGTGQGLAIAHSVIVDKHHGSIEVETEPGAGTTFLIRLPLEPASTKV